VASTVANPSLWFHYGLTIEQPRLRQGHNSLGSAEREKPLSHGTLRDSDFTHSHDWLNDSAGRIIAFSVPIAGIGKSAACRYICICQIMTDKHSAIIQPSD